MGGNLIDMGMGKKRDTGRGDEEVTDKVRGGGKGGYG